MLRYFASVAALAIVFVAGSARAEDKIVSGPMIGHVTSTSARIWMQLPTSQEVTVTCFDEVRGIGISATKVDVEGPSPFICDLPLSGMDPNHNYRIEVKLDGDAVKLPGPNLVIRTAPTPEQESTFTALFASHFDPADKSLDTASLFSAAGDLQPRAFFFLGNAGKLPAKLEDFPTLRRQAFRAICDMHQRVRLSPVIQPLLRTTACYAIWDERDFGTPGAGGDFVFAKESQAAFQRFWANPDWGTPENPGCYFSSSMGDVDFFMLDDRMYRSEKEMLGAAQVEWLKTSLQKSRANFKVIGCGTSLLAQDGSTGWAKFPEERAGFFRWLKENRISGVLFVAGGNAAAVRTAKPDGKTLDAAYPLVELSTGPVAWPGEVVTPAADPALVGKPVTAPNFATLDFGGKRDHRFATLRLRDAHGKGFLEQTIFTGQLAAPQ